MADIQIDTVAADEDSRFVVENAARDHVHPDAGSLGHHYWESD
jgi:hypothetical protein